MLSKNKRLNLKTDFKRVAAGKKLETKYLKLFIQLGDNQIPKVGIAVSSKIFAKATERNRAKRIVAAAVESLYANLPNNINIIALPKRGVINVKSGDVLLDLEEGLKKGRNL